MRNPAALLLFTIATLTLPLPASPQSFEGLVKQRTIEVDEQGLYELLYSQAMDEPEFDTELAWLRYAADKLFSIPPEQLQGGVEGVNSYESTLYVKGDKVRYDHGSGGGQGFILMDAGSRTTWIVNPADRSYITVNADEAEAAAEEAAKTAEEMMAKMGLDPEELREQAEAMGEMEEEGGETGTPTVRPLGKTEEINGFRASGFEAVLGDEIAIGWCAEDASGILKTMEMLAKQAGMEEDEELESGSDMQELVCRGKLPVKVQVFSPSRMNSYVMEEIVAVEATSVSDERFSLPDGYTERKLSDMWR